MVQSHWHCLCSDRFRSIERSYILGTLVDKPLDFTDLHWTRLDAEQACHTHNIVPKLLTWLLRMQVAVSDFIILYASLSTKR